MGSANNKFIATLATSNVLGFIVIFILLWMLWNNTNAPKKNVIVTYSASELQAIQPAAGPQRKPASTPARQSVNAQDRSIITAVAKEFNSNVKSERQIEQKTVKDNGDISKDKTTGALSDDEYVATYDKLASKQQTVKKEFSEKGVHSVQATREQDNKYSSTAGHFNNVDVSQLKDNKKNELSLGQRVAAVASGGFRAGNIKSEKNTAWKDYLKSLKDAEAERKNETRTITVRKGETLWKLSIRAYGTGFKHKKIYEANPHLTSPDSLTVGETLKVPF
jgi:nucleoid-associated protein YgaU